MQQNIFPPAAAPFPSFWGVSSLGAPEKNSTEIKTKNLKGKLGKKKFIGPKFLSDPN